MEPWDGPAAVAFTDGRMIGATLDRNGLRPARYLMTDDGVVMMASEMGVLQFPQEKIIKKWRLQPGKMLLIDMDKGRIIDDEEVKKELATHKPYRQWIDSSRYFLGDFPKQLTAFTAQLSAKDTVEAAAAALDELLDLIMDLDVQS